MRQSRKIRYRTEPSFAFVVDGETEVWYLQMLKRNERNLRLNIKPEIPNKKSIEEQFNLVIDLAESEYLKVFWIVDLDTIIKETRETSKGKITSMQTFIKFQKIIKRDFKNVIVITNNPCLEYWFLLHFDKTTKIFDTCLKAENQLKIHLKDYDKTQKYFTKQDNDIYLKLKPYIKTAISNSFSLGQFDLQETNKSVCEMYLLFRCEELKKYYE